MNPRFGVVAWEEDGEILIIARTHTSEAARALAKVIAKQPRCRRFASIEAADIENQVTLATEPT